MDLAHRIILPKSYLGMSQTCRTRVSNHGLHGSVCPPFLIVDIEMLIVDPVADRPIATMSFVESTPSVGGRDNSGLFGPRTPHDSPPLLPRETESSGSPDCAPSWAAWRRTLFYFVDEWAVTLSFDLVVNPMRPRSPLWPSFESTLAPGHTGAVLDGTQPNL